MLGSMTRREVIGSVLNHEKPPYVPWSFGFTYEAWQKLDEYYRAEDLDEFLYNHILSLGNSIGFFEEVGNSRMRDVFGVVWDRSEDKDIGIVEGCVLPEPTLKNLKLPNPLDQRFFQDIPLKIDKYGDRFRVFSIGFSLFERAWTLRGMENLLMDFHEEPAFVHDLLTAICDYNIAQVNEALRYDIDAVYFGDDWGQQHGLIMGPERWREVILPHLKRMYGTVKAAGKKVFIHSCGDVDELFDDLIGAGLDCFNPFQPEVMDVFGLMDAYRGRLTFHGGLSTQRTLPYGTVPEVREAAENLIERGRLGNYILSPAHAVEGDVPIENMAAIIEVAKAQVD